MKSGSLILLDFLLYFIINSNLLAVYYLLYVLAISVLAGNLSLNSNGLVVILFLNSQSDKSFSNLLDFLCSCFCCNNLAIDVYKRQPV